MKLITSLDLGGGDKVRNAKIPTNMQTVIDEIVAEGLELRARPPIVVFNRLCYQHRSVAFYSDASYGYFYSGTVAKANPMTPKLKELIEFVNKEDSFKSAQTDFVFDRVARARCRRFARRASSQE